MDGVLQSAERCGGAGQHEMCTATTSLAPGMETPDRSGTETTAQGTAEKGQKGREKQGRDQEK